MAGYRKSFVANNDKEAAKIQKALENGCGIQYYNRFLREAESENAIDLNRAGIIITDSLFATYDTFKFKKLCIVPLEEVINVYKSNCFCGTYDYDMKAIAIELNDGSTMYVARLPRRAKNRHFDQAIETFQFRCKNNEGSLMQEFRVQEEQYYVFYIWNKIKD